MPPESSDTSANQWTYVQPRRARKGHKPHTPPLPSKNRLPDDNNISQHRSVSSIQDEYEKTRSQFLQTTCCAQIRRLISSHAQHIQSANIDRAVCLGVGTFDPSDGAWDSKRRSFVQTVAFLLIIEQLEKLLNTTIKCVFQEPLFTPNDIRFLQNLGHQVVDSPTGCEMVTSSTFLYAIHLYNPVYAMALQNDLPAVMVGTGWETLDGMHLMRSEEERQDIARMEEMEKSYDKSDFPQDEHISTFSSTIVYWKPITP